MNIPLDGDATDELHMHDGMVAITPSINSREYHVYIT